MLSINRAVEESNPRPRLRSHHTACVFRSQRSVVRLEGAFAVLVRFRRT